MKSTFYKTFFTLLPSAFEVTFIKTPFPALSILMLFLDKCQMKTFENNNILIKVKLFCLKNVFFFEKSFYLKNVFEKKKIKKIVLFFFILKIKKFKKIKKAVI